MTSKAVEAAADARSVDQRVFEAQLAEYLSSRDEMTAAITNQHYVLTFGSATTLAAFAGGFAIWERGLFPAAVFYSIPALATWVLLVWTGEVARMLRSVHFCDEQESVINRTLASSSSGPALRWESWRQEKGHPERTISWTYIATICFWVLLSSAAFALSAVLMNERSHWAWWALLLMALPWVIIEAPIAWFVVFRVFRPWQKTGIGVPGQ